MGFVTDDACVGRLCAFFVTGDASVEWKVAEMGSFRPTVVPGVSSCFWEASGGALDGRPQAGFVTGGTCVGRLCAFFETGDAFVEWKVAEMGCFRPTVVPVVA